MVIKGRLAPVDDDQPDAGLKRFFGHLGGRDDHQTGTRHHKQITFVRVLKRLRQLLNFALGFFIRSGLHDVLLVFTVKVVRLSLKILVELGYPNLKKDQLQKMFSRVRSSFVSENTMKLKWLKNSLNIICLKIFFATLGIIWLQGFVVSVDAETTGVRSPKKDVKHNHLINESSPYLLQHATNPIDWYPWGEEAFEKAKKENKPIFLSIGYATCHWCHVMERESFSDDEVAALLNRDFVSIKVDREERPDIDQVYMTVTQTLTGRGGWPNTVFLTPDRKPFFAGTYFPKESRQGRTGLMELLPKVAELWQTERENVVKSADQITHLIVSKSETDPDGVHSKLDKTILDNTRNMLALTYDTDHGGFGPAPKFPTPHIFAFLLRQYHHKQDSRALAMVENTLTQMRRGGIYDHIGFGFHRYSTDRQWRVPHFEKMLYDQALLAIAYTEAYQATGKEIYAQTGREILTYVLRELTSTEGGFFSAEDADSEGVEGKFYLWTVPQIQKIIDKDETAAFKKVYNLEDDGNFKSQEAEVVAGSNILFLNKEIPDLARELGLTENQLQQRLEKNRKQLFKVRQNRVHPFKDDKILTDWNGLMIAALARAGQTHGEACYTAAAVRAADFILRKLRAENGRLLKRYRKGDAGLPGLLDDYAFTVWGLLELYEATFETNYLQAAIQITDQMIVSFWDDQDGGFFMTADDGEKLLVRSKSIYDGAIPSGNSVAALNLLRLAHMTGRTEYFKKADDIIRAFAGPVNRYPPGHTQLMVALQYALNPNYEVVIVGRPEGHDTRAMLAALRKPFLPGKVVLLRPVDTKDAAAIFQLAPYTEFMVAQNGKATVYVCTDFDCKLPTTDIAQMLANLQPSEKK